jgi:hypothetical protein
VAKGADVAARSIALTVIASHTCPVRPSVAELTEGDGSGRGVDVVSSPDCVELIGFPFAWRAT